MLLHLSPSPPGTNLAGSPTSALVPALDRSSGLKAWPAFTGDWVLLLSGEKDKRCHNVLTFPNLQGCSLLRPLPGVLRDLEAEDPFQDRYLSQHLPHTGWPWYTNPKYLMKHPHLIS